LSAFPFRLICFFVAFSLCICRRFTLMFSDHTMHHPSPLPSCFCQLSHVDETNLSSYLSYLGSTHPLAIIIWGPCRHAVIAQSSDTLNSFLIVLLIVFYHHLMLLLLPMIFVLPWTVTLLFIINVWRFFQIIFTHIDIVLHFFENFCLKLRHAVEGEMLRIPISASSFRILLATLGAYSQLRLNFVNTVMHLCFINHIFWNEQNRLYLHVIRLPFLLGA
jgi:hypothetical protein